MIGMTKEEVIQEYGKPILEIDIDCSDPHKYNFDVPDKCIVFKLKDNPSGVIVFAYNKLGDEWYANCGHRSVIDYLIKESNILKNKIETLERWNYTEPPKDRYIIRWHVIYKCPIAVIYKPKNTNIKDNCIWTEATFQRLWPEEAFLPCWAEYPEEPKECEYPKLPELDLKCEP